MIDIIKESKPFIWGPEIKFHLRWEIHKNGRLAVFQNWTKTTDAVRKFSIVRMAYNDNDELIIRAQSRCGYIEFDMLKAKLADVIKIEYQHLIYLERNIIASIIVHTTEGIFHCCVNGDIFRGERLNDKKHD